MEHCCEQRHSARRSVVTLHTVPEEQTKSLQGSEISIVKQIEIDEIFEM